MRRIVEWAAKAVKGNWALSLLIPCCIDVSAPSENSDQISLDVGITRHYKPLIWVKAWTTIIVKFEHSDNVEIKPIY